MNTAFGMTTNRVAEIIGPEAAPLIYDVDHAEMIFGVHWRWDREQIFTEAGLTLLVERLGEHHAGSASVLKAEVAKRLARVNPPASLLPEPAAAGRHKPVHSPLNGYQPETED